MPANSKKETPQITSVPQEDIDAIIAAQEAATAPAVEPTAEERISETVVESNDEVEDASASSDGFMPEPRVVTQKLENGTILTTYDDGSEEAE